VNLDVEEDRQSAMGFGITSIPTIIRFKDGKEIQRFVGLHPVEVLSDAIEGVLSPERPYYPKNGSGV